LLVVTTKLMQGFAFFARKEAYDRMVQHAKSLGANAIIGMRYDATEFSDGVTEVLAYGTAVKLN